MSGKIHVTSVYALDDDTFKVDAVLRDVNGTVSIGLKVRANSVAEAEQSGLARAREVARSIVEAEAGA